MPTSETRAAGLSQPEARAREAGVAPRVYVIVLNWNGWRDTLACLESLLRSDYPNFTVVVCDNASQDDSVAHICAWAEGSLSIPPPAHSVLQNLVAPPVPKPLAYTVLDRQQALGEHAEAPPLVVIRTGANLGYAGGNNVGLRYALADAGAQYVWLVNNDTLVAGNALSALVARMHSRRTIGLCGSRLVYYHDPRRTQAWAGARFNPWLGTHRLIGGGRAAEEAADAEVVERRLDYIVGASMMASRAWLCDVGLLCEDYFLYFEEIDWAFRGRRRFSLGYAPHSLVYHKEGATIGSPSRALSVDLLALRNRLLFTWKRVPWALPTVWLGLWAVVANRCRRGQFDRIFPILKLMLTGRCNVS